MNPYLSHLINAFLRLVLLNDKKQASATLYRELKTAIESDVSEKPLEPFDLIKDSVELSSLPEIYMRVSEVLDDPNSSSELIGSVVQVDPALTIRLLKIVNSAFYGFRQEVATVAQAVTIIGRKELRNMVLGTAVSGLFSGMSNKAFSMQAFWHHSVRAAVLAKLLAKYHPQDIESDSLFIAGLLHDVGRLVMAHRMPDKAMIVQQKIDLHDMAAHDAELDVFGFDHADVGAALLGLWELPEILVATVQYHHRPEQAKHYAAEVYRVDLANRLAHLVSPIEADEVSQCLETSNDCAQTGLKKEQVIEACVVAEDQYQLVMALVQ